MNSNKDWLTIEELAEIYGIKRSTQSQLRMKKKIPFSKVGSKMIRYNTEKIDQWLKDAEVKK